MKPTILETQVDEPHRTELRERGLLDKVNGVFRETHALKGEDIYD